jgi:hypothetical protein
MVKVNELGSFVCSNLTEFDVDFGTYMVFCPWGA